MTWKYNPKLKGSGIIECIPQIGLCPNGCKDCFFQSGRSYLEPLADNLPHIPTLEQAKGRVVRVNDGHDSNYQRGLVEHTIRTTGYQDYFFNTAVPKKLGEFSGPVVLTVNPGFSSNGDMTNSDFHKVEKPPENLMFVRVRANTWNRDLVDEAVDFYSNYGISTILTFMAYHNKESIPEQHLRNYVYRERTKNSYWAISYKAWCCSMYLHHDNPLVYSCGKKEGELGSTFCLHCGNCLREYFAAKERNILDF